MPLKLQVVTVSVRYSDFLQHVIPENLKLFDKWIIVTDKKDQATKELCDQYPAITCVQTDAFYENGARFNKYAGINVGLNYVDDDAWILFLDSDIVLHYETRRVIQKLHEMEWLDPTWIYGMDRMNISGLSQWNAYKKGPSMLKENWLLHTNGIELGARLVHHYGHEGENGRFEGYRPLGFFQLCHRSAFDRYPEESKAADHEDLVFARQWPRNRRALIPELFVIHLESFKAGKAINWNGRKSLPFTLEAEGVQPSRLSLVYGETSEFVTMIIERIMILIITALRFIHRMIKLLLKLLKCKRHPTPPPY